MQRILESGSFIGNHSGEAIEGRQLSGLVMSPTRELALQVGRFVLMWLRMGSECNRKRKHERVDTCVCALLRVHMHTYTHIHPL